MGLLFSSEKPLKEVLRENKRMIMRAIRELDRERAALEREEKRLTVDIKNMARKQQMNAVKIMAKVQSGKLIIPEEEDRTLTFQMLFSLIRI
jgi:charged multivesicular body protein 2A